MWSNRFILGVLFSVLSCGSMAKDITGIWKNIDDKTGSSKAVLEVRQEANAANLLSPRSIRRDELASPRRD